MTVRLVVLHCLCFFSAVRSLSSSRINGVSLGGWLLMETTWMYDQFQAPAELDFIRQLRAVNDSFAIQTMRNHWNGYIPDAALDAMAASGIDTVRIPVGYWITESRQYGFQAEGFVTGGIEALERMIAKLKKRGVRALIDLHAVPGGGSMCQSYAGLQVPQPNFWLSSPPGPNVPIPACSNAYPYFSSRNSSLSWMQIGEQAVVRLAQWIVGLQADFATADVVIALEMVNEPALGFAGGLEPAIESFLLNSVPQVRQIFAAAGLPVDVVVNFIGANEQGMGAWTAQNLGTTLVDYHYYLNWAGQMTWDQLNAVVCQSAGHPWDQYGANGLPVFIGEWSDSVNLGALQFTNLSDPTIVSHLATLWANQMSLFMSLPGCVGQFAWTLRMGSGWDPRPTLASPYGHQVPGTSWNQSLPSFAFAVWNYLELLRVGVALPLKTLNIQGVCKCNGCK
jgi:hypothetical protein